MGKRGRPTNAERDAVNEMLMRRAHNLDLEEWPQELMNGDILVTRPGHRGYVIKPDGTRVQI